MTFSFHRHRFIVVIALLLPLPLIAQETSKPTSLIREAVDTKLYSDPVWLAILGYEDQGFFANATESVYVNEAAFLSPDGVRDPKAEMVATLASLYQKNDSNPNEHAQCTYRARYLWLDTKLGLTAEGLPKVECEEFETWRQADTVDSISIMLVSGFLENPASYYGHNMMKLNGASGFRTELQNHSLNFGADIPDEDGILKYIYQGMTGGYTGVFSTAEFFHYANNYGQIEHRDIWEYKLNLNEDELELILAFVWELMGIDIDYYFFNRNCAYRMAKLFEVLRGINLVHGSSFWYSPQTFIQRLTALNGTQRIFNGDVTYFPSRQSSFYLKFYDLNYIEQKHVELSIQDPDYLDRLSTSESDLKSRLRVLDTLLDYYQFVAKNGQANISDTNNPYRRVLSERFQLPPGASEFSITKPEPPHTSRPMSYSSLTYISNTRIDPSISIRIRPAYYDNLDYGAGHVQAANLSMFDADVRLYKENLSVRNLNLVKIESINSRATGLPGDERKSWLLEAGVVQERYDIPDSTVGRLRAQTGYAIPLKGFKGVIGFRAGGSLQSRYKGSEHLQLTATAFVTYEISDKFRAYLTSEYRKGISQQERRVDQATLRYEISNNFDLRVSYEKNIATEIGFSIGTYW